MEFRFGAKHYRVRIDRERLFQDGNELWGYVDHGKREIVISAATPAHERETVLSHEYWHVVEKLLRPADDSESRANAFAEARATFDAEFQDQGGRAALLAMTPEPVIKGAASAEEASAVLRQRSMDEVDYMAGLRQCRDCQMWFGVGNILTLPAVYVGSMNLYVCERLGECECGALTHWGEFCTPEGHPTGRFAAVPAPHVVRGPEATKLRKEMEQRAAAIVLAQG